tara:strand:+ start:2061 stop:2348 length:288 start_codon:yes stop_codon:yes gene_type:complete
MKVKIALTVDLEEVPGKADPLFDRCSEDIKKVEEMLANLKEIREASIEKTIGQIDEIRKIMMDIDLALEDCDAMLTGYLQTISSLNSKGEIQNDG